MGARFGRGRAVGGVRSLPGLRGHSTSGRFWPFVDRLLGGRRHALSVGGCSRLAGHGSSRSVWSDVPCVVVASLLGVPVRGGWAAVARAGGRGVVSSLGFPVGRRLSGARGRTLASRAVAVSVASVATRWSTRVLPRWAGIGAAGRARPFRATRVSGAQRHGPSRHTTGLRAMTKWPSLLVSQAFGHAP